MLAAVATARAAAAAAAAATAAAAAAANSEPYPSHFVGGVTSDAIRDLVGTETTGGKLQVRNGRLSTGGEEGGYGEANRERVCVCVCVGGGAASVRFHWDFGRCFPLSAAYVYTCTSVICCNMNSSHTNRCSVLSLAFRSLPSARQ